VFVRLSLEFSDNIYWRLIRYFTLDGYSFIRAGCNSIDILIGLGRTLDDLAVGY
jgi:hypothetical protein